MHKIFLKNSVKQSNGVESFFFQCTIKGEEKREKNASIFFSFVLRNILCLVRVLNDIQLVRHIFIHVSKENGNRMHLHKLFLLLFPFILKMRCMLNFEMNLKMKTLSNHKMLAPASA